MSSSIHWFLPTSGDGREVLASGLGWRPPTIQYLAQIARAAEQLGYVAVLTPTGTWCEDAWLITTALSRETERLKFLVAFRPGAISPTLAAQKASTFQRITDGRLLLNVVSGGDPGEQRSFGDWLDHDERYDRTDEFLTVLRGAWEGPFDFTGRHYRVEHAQVLLAPEPRPPLYFGGASEAAEVVAARHADVYLTWGEPPAMVGPRLDRVRALAEAAGRELRFGIRLHVIARPTAEEAWAEAGRLLEAIDPATIDRMQRAFARSESVGQRRMSQLHGGRPDELEVSPNLWAGIGLVRGGAGTALVGSFEQIAERIVEYERLGFSEFVFSGYPHLEEAYWFGEGVLPLLDHAGRSQTARPFTYQSWAR